MEPHKVEKRANVLRGGVKILDVPLKPRDPGAIEILKCPILRNVTKNPFSQKRRERERKPCQR
jgi:hypothetical protein